MLFFTKGSSRVNYLEPSSSRVLEFEGHYISDLRLKGGNMKLIDILIFDLPAVETCLNCDDCKLKCYAKKAEVQYKDTYVFRQTNLALYKHDRALLFELIVKQISESKINSIRIHASGDFFNQSYIDFWCDIVKMFPSKKFYAYSKVIELFDFSNIEGLSNFNLINSIVADIHLNFGSVEYCQSLNKKYNTFICPATLKENVKCGLDCSYCITNKNVCFVQH